MAGDEGLRRIRGLEFMVLFWALAFVLYRVWSFVLVRFPNDSVFLEFLWAGSILSLSIFGGIAIGLALYFLWIVLRNITNDLSNILGERQQKHLLYFLVFVIILGFIIAFINLWYWGKIDVTPIFLLLGTFIGVVISGVTINLISNYIKAKILIRRSDS